MGCGVSSHEKELEIEFENLKLQEVDLRGQSLTALPPLPGAHDATTLYLQSNFLSSLPKNLLEWASLQELDLSSNRFVSVPPGLTTLPALTQLDVSNNPISTDGWDAIRKLKKLKRLRAAACFLKSVPPPIVECPALTALDVSENNGLDLSTSELPRMILLSQFSGRDCGFDAISECFTKLPHLALLDLSDNPIDRSDVHGGNFVSLRRIVLEHTNLRRFPRFLVGMDELQQLALSRNAIRSLDGIERFRNLKLLDLSALLLPSAKERRLPTCAISIPSIETLVLNDNFGISVDGIDKLFPNLTALSLVGTPYSRENAHCVRETKMWDAVINLQKLREVTLATCAAYGRYSTRLPLQLCGTTLQKFNGIHVSEELFVGEFAPAVVNILLDGFYKLDFMFENDAVHNYLCLISLFEPSLCASVCSNTMLCARRYFVYLSCQKAGLVPPLDVCLVHYAHMIMDPVGFRELCARIGSSMGNSYRHQIVGDPTECFTRGTASYSQAKNEWAELVDPTLMPFSSEFSSDSDTCQTVAPADETEFAGVLSQLIVSYEDQIRDILQLRPHFETLTLDCWTRYAKFLSVASCLKSKGKGAVYATLGILLMLHIHRTEPEKYKDDLAMWKMERLEVETSKDAFVRTEEEWQRLFRYPFISRFVDQSLEDSHFAHRVSSFTLHEKRRSIHQNEQMSSSLRMSSGLNEADPTKRKHVTISTMQITAFQT